MVVTRFAPSPTGYLHVGGARTALFSWALARHHAPEGEFLLRIEDTDLARSTEQATQQLVEDLKWLGLHWDNKELVFQSKRLDVYNRIIDGLIASGRAYKAYDTREELDAMRKQAEKEKRDFVYRRRVIAPDVLARYEAEGRPHVVRFAMPVKEYVFHDVVLGKDVTLAPTQVQDFVIRKTDGMPTYHFAVVVDDAEMGVTHILRGQEHLLNTVNHIGLQEALGYARPTYGHLPIIMNLDGSKMGKRDRDKKIREKVHNHIKNTKQPAEAVAGAASLDAARFAEWLKDASKQLDIPEQAAVMRAVGMKESELPEILVHDFRKNGYLPEALLNFLALLGWNPGGDRERMSMEELVQLFAIDGIGKSNAKFDRQKLLSFNTDALKEAPVSRLVPAIRDYLAVNPESPLNRASDADLATVIEMKRGVRTLREMDETTGFFFVADEQLQYDAGAMEKVLKKNDGEGLNALKDLRGLLAGATEWKHQPLEQTVQGYCDSNGLGLGKVAQPLRLAISGGTVSPPIFQSIEFLGRERTLGRIDRCLANAG